MAVIKRLSKVARELNVGISTIVDFLNEQGNEVSSNPNTKIDENLYMILLKEFQSEKFEKEKADQVRIEHSERTVISIKKDEPSKKEVEKIVAKADKLSGAKVLGKIDLVSKPKPTPKSEEKAIEKPVKEEISTMKFAFASVVSIKDIKKGEKLSYENIWVKRPGTGSFLARDFNKLIGKIAKRNLKSNIQINKKDIIL